jgi:hypothetical protein
MADRSYPKIKPDGLPLETGAVFSFLTEPYWESSPPHSGRYAAFKIIGADDALVILAVYDGIWAEPPTLDQFAETGILKSKRFSGSGREVIFGTEREDWEGHDLKELQFIGHHAPDKHELFRAQKIFNDDVGSVYATPCNASTEAEGEWRWKHDRAAFKQEREQ